MNPDRLWPVLLVTVLALAGVGVVEWIGGHPEPRYRTVAVVWTGGAEGSGDPGDATWQSTAPLSPAHAHARQMLTRGEIDLAVGEYAALVEAADVPPFLLGEAAYAMRRAGRCADAAPLIARALQALPEDGALHLGDAMTRKCLGDVDGARAAVERSVAARPNHSGTRQLYATYLAGLGDPGAALAILQPATQAGSNEERAQAFASFARISMQAGRYASGGAAVEQAIQRAPSEVGIWLSGARALLESPEAAHHARALELAEQAIALAPELAAAHTVAARALEALNRAEAAFEYYRRSSELDGSSRFVRVRLLELGLRYDAATAQRAAEVLLEQHPGDPEYLFYRGLAAARAGDPDAARESYQATIAARGGNAPEAWFNLGLLEREAGRLEQARSAYLQALAVRPAYDAAWNNLGLVHFDRGAWDEAEAAFRQALLIRSDYAAAWSNLGRTFAARDDYASAADALEQALRYNPGDRVDRLRLAAAWRRIGRVDDAVALYRRLLEDEPRYVSAWYNLGIALVAAGRDAEARDAYRRAIEIDPNHQNSLENLGYLEARLGDLDAALEHLLAALDREPADLDLRLKAAEVAADLGDLERCRTELGAARQQAPADPRVPPLVERCRGSGP